MSAGSSSSSVLTVEELRSFHSIDRQIYYRLVINLGRDDLIECMHVLALWLWLEELGYPNVILKLLALPDSVLNQIADEAVLCLRSFQSQTPPPPPPLHSSIIVTDHEIPLSQELMEGMQISLSLLHEHRLSALQRITQTVNDVWPRAFADIAQQALANRAMMRSNTNSRSPTGGSVVLQQELVGPPSARFRPATFQPPVLVGSGIGILRQPPAGLVFQQRSTNHIESLSKILETGESSESQTSSSLNPIAKPWNPSDNSEESPHGGDRTMFITFSRGYPITERELRDFLIRSYGSDCIEELIMQEVPPNKQPLYSRVLFRSARTIAMILEGKEKAKFSINGKHVWARLYVEKQNHSATPPTAPEDTS